MLTKKQLPLQVLCRHQNAQACSDHRHCMQVRLRTAAAHLAAGNADLALHCATSVLQESAADSSSTPTAASARAVKLTVSALLALGQQGEAAAQLADWLRAGSCPDARTCCGVLRTFVGGCDLTRAEGAEQLWTVAAAALRAFPGRHDPAMAVVEKLLAQQVGCCGAGCFVALKPSCNWGDWAD